LLARDPADLSQLERMMLDLLVVAIAVAFFAAAIGYCTLCERL
jgi:hypothetical protein